MSYDSWKLRSDLDDSCNQFAEYDCEQTYEDIEEAAAMLNVTVEEYLSNKAIDRWVARHQPPEDDQIPF
jgi:hypothetical protein